MRWGRGMISSRDDSGVDRWGRELTPGDTIRLLRRTSEDEPERDFTYLRTVTAENGNVWVDARDRHGKLRSFHIEEIELTGRHGDDRMDT